MPHECHKGHKAQKGATSAPEDGQSQSWAPIFFLFLPIRRAHFAPTSMPNTMTPQSGPHSALAARPDASSGRQPASQPSNQSAGTSAPCRARGLRETLCAAHKHNHKHRAALVMKPLRAPTSRRKVRPRGGIGAAITEPCERLVYASSLRGFRVKNGSSLARSYLFVCPAVWRAGRSANCAT